VRGCSATACFESNMGEVSRGSRRPHRFETALLLFARRSCSPASSSSTAWARGRRRYGRRSLAVVPPQMPAVAPPSYSRKASARQSLRTGHVAHISTASSTRAFPSPSRSLLLPSSQKKSSGSESLHAAAAVHGRICKAQAKEARAKSMSSLPHHCEWRSENQNDDGDETRLFSTRSTTATPLGPARKTRPGRKEETAYGSSTT
jgi:hypothetical protein